MIDFDFAAASRQANELEEVAQEMKSLSGSKMDGTMQQIAGSWKGESAAAFLAKCDILRQEIAATSEKLFSIAASVRAAAQKMYEAEQEAKRLSNESSYV